MRWSFIFVALLSLLPVRLARAQGASAVTRVRLVIPQARGRKKYGGARLSRSLRRTMADGVGPLIPARSLRSAQSKLGLRGKARWRRRNLARAGREIGADYVLYTTIKRKGWLYTARARLINTATNEVQMDFRSQYYDPVKETADRGERIGRRTLLKMQTLAEEGALLATGRMQLAPSERAPSEAAAVAPVRRSAPPPSSANPPPTETTPPIPSLATPEDDEFADEFADELDDDIEIEEPPAAPPVRPAPPPSAPPEPPPNEAPEDSEDDELKGFDDRAGSVAAVVPRRSRARRRLRVDLSAGAGLLRRYDVSSTNVPDSALSYPLDPTALVRAGGELVFADTPFGLKAEVAFRPVQYEIGPVDEQPETPAGFLFDTAVWATYRIDVVGSDARAFRIIPKVGARVDVASVADHDSDLVVSATAVSLDGGLTLRWPVNETLELSAAVEGGWIASYTESPTESGDSGNGFTVGGGMDVRLWLTPALGIAVDTRYRFARISFEGVPRRPVPAAEDGQLENLTVATQDLLTSVGVAVRI